MPSKPIQFAASHEQDVFDILESFCAPENPYFSEYVESLRDWTEERSLMIFNAKNPHHEYTKKTKRSKSATCIKDHIKEMIKNGKKRGRGHYAKRIEKPMGR
jgi:3-methyladenine DNA glycosylase AlkC